MSLNLPLIDAVLEQIDAKPETWDQSMWRNECGSAFCFAGWAAELSSNARWADGAETAWSVFVVAKGRRHWVRDWARDELGLSPAQSDALFYSENTRDDIEDILDAIREGAL